uniref:Uncharacterized protein n=1 Tax=Cacopsylla melanoneura TaxID=428564 RepID=A0A8D8SY11_9HEMI
MCHRVVIFLCLIISHYCVNHLNYEIFNVNNYNCCIMYLKIILFFIFNKPNTLDKNSKLTVPPLYLSTLFCFLFNNSNSIFVFCLSLIHGYVYLEMLIFCYKYFKK